MLIGTAIGASRVRRRWAWIVSRLDASQQSHHLRGLLHATPGGFGFLAGSFRACSGLPTLRGLISARLDTYCDRRAETARKSDSAGHVFDVPRIPHRFGHVLSGHAFVLMMLESKPVLRTAQFPSCSRRAAVWEKVFHCRAATNMAGWLA